METKQLIKSLIIAVFFSALGWSYTAAQEVIKAGYVSCLTGPGALWALVGKQGLTMGLDDVNAKVGVHGKKIELITYDSQSKPQVAATLAQRLIHEDKVPLIFGSSSSLDNLAMMEVTERAKIPLYICIASSPVITEKGYKWVWRGSDHEKITAQITAKYIIGKPAWNRVALLYENSDFGKPPSEVLAGLIKDSKKELVAMEGFGKGDTDISGQLLKIKKADPDVLVLWGYHTEYALIARQRQQIGLRAQLIGNAAMGFPEYIKLGGTATEGSMFNTTVNSDLNPDPRVKAFAERYTAKFSRPLSVGVIDAYNGAIIISEVLNKVGTNAEKIQNALNSMTFQGLVCP